MCTGRYKVMVVNFLEHISHLFLPTYEGISVLTLGEMNRVVRYERKEFIR